MADEVKLIDTNALKESLKKYKVKGYNHKYVQGMQDAIDGYFPRIIDDAPTIEAEPVKHGKWIEKKVSRMKWIPYADDDVNPDDVDIECMTEQKCSYCKRWTIKFTYHIELDYCPLCGARMDGDSDE